MKAFLIDSKNKEVKEIEMTDNWEEIPQTLGCEVFSCPHVTTENDVMYCDDEGLLKPLESFFLLESYPQPIAGNGLILGDDGEGGSESAHVDLETLKKRVTFMSPNDAYNWSLKQEFMFN